MNPAALADRKEENSRLLREDIGARRTVFRGLPEVVALHTTERCNLACIMCVRALGPGKIQLPRDRLGEICDALFPTAKKAALSAAAGEPLLADFDLVMDRARAHGVRVDVVTNGTGLTADLYRACAPLFDHVNVSIDSSVPEVYERVRYPARFSRVEGNLREIAEERARAPDGVLLSLSAVVMRSTLPHLGALVRFSRDVGADGVILQRLQHSGKATPEEDPFTSPGPAAVREAFEAVRATARECGVSVAFSDFDEPNLLLRPIREKVPPVLLGTGLCSYLAQHIGVQPTGEVFACCYPTDYRLGDLLRQDVQEIWNGPASQRLRAAHFSRRGALFCSGCIHAPHLKARRPAWLVRWLRERRLRRLRRKLPRLGVDRAARG